MTFPFNFGLNPEVSIQYEYTHDISNRLFTVQLLRINLQFVWWRSFSKDKDSFLAGG